MLCQEDSKELICVDYLDQQPLRLTRHKGTIPKKRLVGHFSGFEAQNTIEFASSEHTHKSTIVSTSVEGVFALTIL